MSYNNQNARVYGDNNVVGHGNTITRNEIHNHNQSGGGGGKKKNSNGDEGRCRFPKLRPLVCCPP